MEGLRDLLGATAAMGYIDKTLNCCSCGNDFEFPATQQQHFEKLGFTNEPKRCPDCRAKRKQLGPAPRRSEGAGGGPREFFSAVCAECGKPANVPFRPTGNRPVYCSECFQTKK
jgi:CxxC-x17-CxxC domain-containing protein